MDDILGSLSNDLKNVGQTSPLSSPLAFSSKKPSSTAAPRRALPPPPLSKTLHLAPSDAFEVIESPDSFAGLPNVGLGSPGSPSPSRMAFLDMDPNAASGTTVRGDHNGPQSASLQSTFELSSPAASRSTPDLRKKKKDPRNGGDDGLRGTVRRFFRWGNKEENMKANETVTKTAAATETQASAASQSTPTSTPGPAATPTPSKSTPTSTPKSSPIIQKKTTTAPSPSVSPSPSHSKKDSSSSISLVNPAASTSAVSLPQPTPHGHSLSFDANDQQFRKVMRDYATIYTELNHNHDHDEEKQKEPISPSDEEQKEMRRRMSLRMLAAASAQAHHQARSLQGNKVAGELVETAFREEIDRVLADEDNISTVKPHKKRGSLDNVQFEEDKSHSGLGTISEAADESSRPASQILLNSPPVVEGRQLPSETVVPTPAEEDNDSDTEATSIAQRLMQEDVSLVKRREDVLAYLAEPSRRKILDRYMRQFDFTGQRLDISMRRLCAKLYIRGETQQVDRVIEAFARRYHLCNPRSLYGTTDVVHTIAYSLLLLNTDLHIANLDHHMSRRDFTKNTLRTVQEVRPPPTERDRIDSAEPTPSSNKRLSVVSTSRSVLHEPLDRVPTNSSSSDRPKLTSASTSSIDSAWKRWWDSQIEQQLKDMYMSIKANQILQPLVSDDAASVKSSGSKKRNRMSGLSSSFASLGRSRSVLGDGPGHSSTSRVNAIKNSSYGRDSMISVDGMISTNTSASDLSFSRNDSALTLPTNMPSYAPRSNALGFASSLSHLTIREDTAQEGRHRHRYQTSMSTIRTNATSASDRSIPTPDARQSTPNTSEAGRKSGLSKASTEDDDRASIASIDDDLILSGAPWAKEGMLQRKHFYDSHRKRAKDRAWRDFFVVVQHGAVGLYKFQSSAQGTHSQKKLAKLMNEQKAKSSVSINEDQSEVLGGGFGGGNWSENAKAMGNIALRHALANALPPPGYNSARPYVYSIELPSGEMWFFQTGTAELVNEWVFTCNYWAARESKEPLTGGVGNMDYGWGRSIEAFVEDEEDEDIRPSTTNPLHPPIVDITEYDSNEDSDPATPASPVVRRGNGNLRRDDAPSDEEEERLESEDGHSVTESIQSNMSGSMFGGSNVGAKRSTWNMFRTRSKTGEAMTGSTLNVGSDMGHRSNLSITSIGIVSQSGGIMSHNTAKPTLADRRRKAREEASKVHLNDWKAPVPPNVSSNLNEAEQLKSLKKHVAGLEKDLKQHNTLRKPMLAVYRDKTPNHYKAFGNWENKSKYLVHEIVKYQTYVDAIEKARKIRIDRRAEQQQTLKSSTGSSADIRIIPPDPDATIKARSANGSNRSLNAVGFVRRGSASTLTTQSSRPDTADEDINIGPPASVREITDKMDRTIKDVQSWKAKAEADIT